MSKGKRNRKQREAVNATVAAAFNQKLPLAAPLAVPGQAPVKLSAATLIDELPAKAVKREIAKRLEVAHREFIEAELSCILYALHKNFGFGKKRLMRFCREYKPVIKQLTDFYAYEYESSDAPFACVQALKNECNFDIPALWDSEMEM